MEFGVTEVNELVEASAALERTAAQTHRGYRLTIEPSGQRISAVFNGVTVAESRHVLVMHETRLPSYY